MSVFICPHCGGESPIFDAGGAERLAAEQGTVVVGRIPLDMQIRADSDAGTPIVAAHPESPQAAAYRALAGETARRLSMLAGEKRIDIPIMRAS